MPTTNSAHQTVINEIATHLATLRVKDSIRRQGKKLSDFSSSDIFTIAKDLVHNDPRYKQLAEDCITEALNHD